MTIMGASIGPAGPSQAGAMVAKINVCFGSIASFPPCNRGVGFTPNNGHPSALPPIIIVTDTAVASDQDRPGIFVRINRR